MSVLKIRNNEGVFEGIPLVKGDPGTKIIQGVIELDENVSKYYLKSVQQAEPIRNFDYIIDSPPLLPNCARLWTIMSNKTTINAAEIAAGDIEVVPTQFIQMQGPQGTPGSPFYISAITSYEEISSSTDSQILKALPAGAFVLVECQNEHTEDEVCHNGEIYYKTGSGEFKLISSINDLKIVHGRSIFETDMVAYNPILKQYCANQVRLPLGRYIQKDDLLLDKDGKLWRVTEPRVQYTSPDGEIHHTIPVDDTDYNLKGPKGDDGLEGVGIRQIVVDSEDDYSIRYKVVLSNNTSQYFETKKGLRGPQGDQGDKGEKGEKGDVGRGILTIEEINTFPDDAPEEYKENSLIHCYKIVFDDHTSSSYFYVKDGETYNLTSEDKEEIAELVTEVPLDNYATLKYVQEEPKLYRHSIIMRMADTNGFTEKDNSICGAFMISFDLINNDPEPYTFDHTAKASGSETPTAMYPLEAWQLLRLYRALSTSVILPPPPTPKTGEEYSYHSLTAMGMLVDRRPCSGSIIGAKGVGRGAVNTIWAGYNKYNELKSGNQVIPNTAERVICITGELFVADAGFDDLEVKITCGRANVSDPIVGEDLQETSLWESFEEFVTKEYQVRRAETGSDLGDNYFFTRRLYCKDLVEDLNPYAPMSIIRPTEKDLVIAINDTAYTYKVRKGMTWDHWVKSDYNTDGYAIGGSGDGYIGIPESLYGKTGGKLYLEGKQVSPTDFIDESQNYKA